MNVLEEFFNELAQNASTHELFSTKKIVKSCGLLKATIALIGEAPGKHEEEQGAPFVGSAGKNLDHFLEQLSLPREELYITNVVKIRPCKINPKTGRVINRPPNKEELAFFIPYLMKELQLVSPQWIVTLGNVPLRALLSDPTASIGYFHGRLQKNDLYTIFPLYHPASIIYNQQLKEVYHQDLNALRETLQNSAL